MCEVGLPHPIPSLMYITETTVSHSRREDTIARHSRTQSIVCRVYQQHTCTEISHILPTNRLSPYEEPIWDARMSRSYFAQEFIHVATKSLEAWVRTPGPIKTLPCDTTSNLWLFRTRFATIAEGKKNKCWMHPAQSCKKIHIRSTISLSCNHWILPDYIPTVTGF